jgi:hypothetical protein
VPIVAISESARAAVPHPLRFVGVVHHGLPLDAFKVISQPRQHFLTWLGRFVPEKGAHLAIEVAKQADVPLVLAGTVDQSNPVEITHFHLLLSITSWKKRIRWSA